MIIGNQSSKIAGRRFIAAAHPIHLHGHDFAILQQSEAPYNNETSLNLKLDNPPRRDVVLLPLNGFVVIAFRADNPGAWLIHCHIVWHASSGLAMEILERAPAINPPLFSDGFDEPIKAGCRDWEKWFSDPTNLWSSDVSNFQDDSGI